MLPIDPSRRVARFAAPLLVVLGLVGCTGGGGEGEVAAPPRSPEAPTPSVSEAPAAPSGDAEPPKLEAVASEAEKTAASVGETAKLVPAPSALPSPPVAPKPSAPPPASSLGSGGAPTPKELLEKFVDALEKGDKETIIACLDRESPNAELMATSIFAPTIGVLNRQREFRGQLEAKFGPEFAKGLSILPSQIDLTQGFEMLRQKIAIAEIREEGDTAKITIPGETSESPMELTKRDGSWFFVPSPDQLPPPDKIEMTRTLMVSLAEAYDKSSEALEGAEDPEAYKRQFQQIQAELMMKVMAAAAAAQEQAGGGAGGTPKLPIPGGQ